MEDNGWMDGLETSRYVLSSTVHTIQSICMADSKVPTNKCSEHHIRHEFLEHLWHCSCLFLLTEQQKMWGFCLNPTITIVCDLSRCVTHRRYVPAAGCEKQMDGRPSRPHTKSLKWPSRSYWSSEARVCRGGTEAHPTLHHLQPLTHSLKM